jgi:hypothetical protein
VPPMHAALLDIDVEDEADTVEPDAYCSTSCRALRRRPATEEIDHDRAAGMPI